MASGAACSGICAHTKWFASEDLHSVLPRRRQVLDTCARDIEGQWQPTEESVYLAHGRKLTRGDESALTVRVISGAVLCQQRNARARAVVIG